MWYRNARKRHSRWTTYQSREHVTCSTVWPMLVAMGKVGHIVRYVLGDSEVRSLLMLHLFPA